MNSDSLQHEIEQNHSPQYELEGEPTPPGTGIGTSSVTSVDDLLRQVGIRSTTVSPGSSSRESTPMEIDSTDDSKQQQQLERPPVPNGKGEVNDLQHLLRVMAQQRRVASQPSTGQSQAASSRPVEDEKRIDTSNVEQARAARRAAVRPQEDEDKKSEEKQPEPDDSCGICMRTFIEKPGHHGKICENDRCHVHHHWACWSEWLEFRSRVNPNEPVACTHCREYTMQTERRFFSRLVRRQEEVAAAGRAAIAGLQQAIDNFGPLDFNGMQRRSPPVLAHNVRDAQSARAVVERTFRRVRVLLDRISVAYNTGAFRNTPPSHQGQPSKRRRTD